MERPGAMTLKGNPFTLIGPELKPGDAAPDFTLTDNGLKPVTLKDTGNQVRIVSADQAIQRRAGQASGRRRHHRQHGPAVGAKALVRRLRRQQSEDALRP